MDGVATLGSKIACDSVNSVLFVSGMAKSARAYSFDKPCPPTPARIADFNVDAAVASTPGFKGITEVPNALASTYIVNKFAVNEIDQAFFNSLIKIVADDDARETLTEGADGSGRALVGLLQTLAGEADDQDRSLCSTKFTNYVSAGLAGAEMKKDIFVTWWKGYKSLLRGLPPDERPKDHQEIAMLNNMPLARASQHQRHRGQGRRHRVGACARSATC